MKIISTLLLLFTFSSGFAQVPNKAELVSVNGKSIYYESYGEGEPLFFFHGYTLSSKSWIPYIQDFAPDYEIYLVDLTGHGRSDTYKKDLSIQSVAEDMNALVKYLQLPSIQAIGFSYGGDVLYQLALLNPTLIKSMVTIGAVGSWDVQDFPEYQEAFVYENLDQFTWMPGHHMSDHQIKEIFNQFKNYRVHLSDEELRKIEPEVMIILGDDDNGITMEAVARARRNLPNSDLWILPDMPHSAHEGESKDEFVRRAKTFLSKEIPEE